MKNNLIKTVSIILVFFVFIEVSFGATNESTMNIIDNIKMKSVNINSEEAIVGEARLIKGPAKIEKDMEFGIRIKLTKGDNGTFYGEDLKVKVFPPGSMYLYDYPTYSNENGEWEFRMLNLTSEGESKIRFLFYSNNNEAIGCGINFKPVFIPYSQKLINGTSMISLFGGVVLGFIVLVGVGWGMSSAAADRARASWDLASLLVAYGIAGGTYLLIEDIKTSPSFEMRNYLSRQVNLFELPKNEVSDLLKQNNNRVIHFNP